ncbi:hypothetical protein OG455_27805 [Kitasatospora sp. NBC_01287]|uniref:hypothetical protein n=1 Tax=Kitasatospora sp. NBC_01287 TaxID=2903573 RepID=UPI00225447DF|nr:hypothetical protein [Kitasatospora sp. NBC_01287]MCX4749267.1 hypothetical protein [Kitasatospora sp. NBC_01287]
MNTPPPRTEQGIQALLITEDGTTTPVTLPATLSTGHAARAAIAQHLGGRSWLGYCHPACSPDTHFITVGLLERPPAGTPRNDCATAVAEVLRHAPLRESIHGPALVMGPTSGDDVPTSLEPGQQQAIRDFVATWRALLA